MLLTLEHNLFVLEMMKIYIIYDNHLSIRFCHYIYDLVVFISNIQSFANWKFESQYVCQKYKNTLKFYYVFYDTT